MSSPDTEPDQSTDERVRQQETESIGEQSSLWGDAWRRLRTNPMFIVSAFVVLLFTAMAIVPQAFTSLNRSTDCQNESRNTGEYCWQDPGYAELGRSKEAPTPEHPFGFDVQGRDQLSRIIYGARNSMSIGLTTTFGAVLFALILGSWAGYLGGMVDALLSRVTDIIFAIPTLLAGIVFLNIVEERKWFHVAALLIAFGWPLMMRIVRSQVMAEKEREYVQAARALGANDFRVITRHILPNSLAPLVVYATIYIGGVISAEAALSFLGVGLQLPAISWGLMVSEAQKRLLEAPHLLIFPSAFISLTVFGFILMGDALRDALDPKLQ